jgi:LmbE family N-acetylglucosaminyl deacetylase
MSTEKEKKMRIVVVAPHPDDEVFGCGGTIPTYSEAGHEVHVLIVTKGDELFDPHLIETGRKEALKSHSLLGVKETRFADLPSIKLDTLPQHKINDLLLDYFQEIRPDLLFLPFPGDLNRDHQIVHACAMVAARPIGVRIQGIYCYEALSSTNWNSPGIFAAFTPNCFVDISEKIDLKVEAAKVYASQLKKSPHERSVESILALGRYRGGFVNIPYAEAFMCIRQILL